MSAIVSEKIEPAFSHLVGCWFDECEKSGDKEELLDNCINFWHGINALNKATCCFRKGGVHASIAVGNELRRVSEYIEMKIEYNPLSSNKNPAFLVQ